MAFVFCGITTIVHRMSVPTHFDGCLLGHVTKYYQTAGGVGMFVVVISGVEYTVEEPPDLEPTPIRPGYYQIDLWSFNHGVVLVIIGDDHGARAAGPFGTITEERPARFME
jgi:hypothetical protein